METDSLAVDKTLDGQLDHLRSMLRWYDSRFGWSSTGAIAAVLFLTANVGAPKYAHGHTAAGYIPFYFLGWACGILSALVSLWFSALGMLADTPWQRKVRDKFGCNGIFWAKSVAQFKNAHEFVSAIDDIDEKTLRIDRTREIWRLSRLVDNRATLLLVSRFLATFAWLCVGYSILMLVDMGARISLPTLKI